MREGFGLALVAVAACSPPDIPGAVVSRGRHVELHAAPTLPVCDEALTVADSYLEALGDLLDTPVPEVTYYLYDGEVSGCRITGLEAADCTSGHTVYAARWPHFHELVHTVTDSWGRPPAFLVEGLAEGLGSPYPQLTPDQRASAALELDTVAFYASDAVAHYQVAADFAVYLLARFGARAYRQLSEDLLYLTDSVTLHATFQRVTGVALDDVIADWRTAEPAHVRLPLDDARCHGPAIAPSAADTWSSTATLSCASARYVDETVYYSIEPATPGWYSLAGSVGAPALSMEAEVNDCGAGDDLRDGDSFMPGKTSTDYVMYNLAAGPHAVGVFIARPLLPVAPVDTTWQLALVGPSGADCTTAPAFAAPDGKWSLFAGTTSEQWPGRVDDPVLGTLATTWLRLDLPAADDMISVYGGGTAGQVCSGPCQNLSGCATFGPGNEFGAAFWHPTPGQPAYVELRAPISSDEVFLDAQY